MKKYIAIFLFVVQFVFLICSHNWCYKQGYKAAVAELKTEYTNTIATQQKAIENANQKILDFQRIISYNHDECFNRVWPDEIIRATNPILR